MQDLGQSRLKIVGVTAQKCAVPRKWLWEALILSIESEPGRRHQIHILSHSPQPPSSHCPQSPPMTAPQWQPQTRHLVLSTLELPDLAKQEASLCRNRTPLRDKSLCPPQLAPPRQRAPEGVMKRTKYIIKNRFHPLRKGGVSPEPAERSWAEH